MLHALIIVIAILVCLVIYLVLCVCNEKEVARQLADQLANAESDAVELRSEIKRLKHNLEAEIERANDWRLIAYRGYQHIHRFHMGSRVVADSLSEFAAKRGGWEDAQFTKFANEKDE